MSTSYERFVELMRDRNLRVIDVAKSTGISQATFSDWKMGRSTPKIDKMKKLSLFFNVDTDYLIGNTDVKSPYKKQIQLFDIDKAVMEQRKNKETLNAIRKFSHDDKEDIKSALKRLSTAMDINPYEYLPPVDKMLIEKFESLSPEMQEIFMNLLDTIVAKMKSQSSIMIGDFNGGKDNDD